MIRYILVDSLIVLYLLALDLLASVNICLAGALHSILYPSRGVNPCLKKFSPVALLSLLPFRIQVMLGFKAELFFIVHLLAEF